METRCQVCGGTFAVRMAYSAAHTTRMILLERDEYNALTAGQWTEVVVIEQYRSGIRLRAYVPGERTARYRSRLIKSGSDFILAYLLVENAFSNIPSLEAVAMKLRREHRALAAEVCGVLRDYRGAVDVALARRAEGAHTPWWGPPRPSLQDFVRDTQKPKPTTRARAARRHLES